MRQVVFADVLIVGRLDVHGQSCAPIGSHKTDAPFDWLVQKALPGVQLHRCDFSIYRKEEVLCQLKIRGAIEKFKNQPRPLFRPRYVNFSEHF